MLLPNIFTRRDRNKPQTQDPIRKGISEKNRRKRNQVVYRVTSNQRLPSPTPQLISQNRPSYS